MSKSHYMPVAPQTQQDCWLKTMLCLGIHTVSVSNKPSRLVCRTWVHERLHRLVLDGVHDGRGYVHAPWPAGSWRRRRRSPQRKVVRARACGDWAGWRVCLLAACTPQLMSTMQACCRLEATGVEGGSASSAKDDFLQDPQQWSWAVDTSSGCLHVHHRVEVSEKSCHCSASKPRTQSRLVLGGSGHTCSGVRLEEGPGRIKCVQLPAVVLCLQVAHDKPSPEP